MDSKKLLIKCEVSKGMFESERIITVNSQEGTVESIVSACTIKNNNSIYIERYEEDEISYIIFIPGEIIKGHCFTRINKL